MSHPVDIQVGQRLKQLRTARGLSQTDLGNKLELSFQQIQKYEAGSNRISASRLFELAQALSVGPAYFFDGMHGEQNSSKSNASGMAVATALASIESDDTKRRILSFIEDVSAAKL
ncbi:helix-turn-helix domain-containing protein [Sulfitobacter sp.]|uniref:helix-turn-helix domain-containing protein n=1 Tax=Sulfitobacter sp. TaxID=1903071 RepID=UPI00300119EB